MKLTAFILFNFITLISFAQSPERVLKKLGSNPVFFMDSVNVLQSDLQQYRPEEIASVTVFKDKEAIDILGEEGKDGVVYIETIPFAKKRYWKYFKTKSKSYGELLPNFDSDSTILYIINKRVLSEKGYEGTLAAINDKVFKEIMIVDKATLEKQYGITNKLYGVVIVSDVPDNLYNGKKKF
ncbi:hypothetical protein [Pedobacter heparinus]|uniref:hypothetical protein n=1 Tax=Pedobacter heparinus TaxID=984 RepID=UPI0029314D96|nr:hypothetical protein [Pedobacter heparinus]